MLAVLSHIVTRPVPPPPPRPKDSNLSGRYMSSGIYKTEGSSHEPTTTLAPRHEQRCDCDPVLFLPRFSFTRLRSDHLKGLRRSAGHACARHLHLEEPTRAPDAPKVTAWVTWTVEQNFFSFKKKKNQDKTQKGSTGKVISTDGGLVFFLFVFSTTDKNIAQGRRSDWQEERNRSGTRVSFYVSSTTQPGTALKTGHVDVRVVTSF